MQLAFVCKTRIKYLATLFAFLCYPCKFLASYSYLEIETPSPTPIYYPIALRDVTKYKL